MLEYSTMYFSLVYACTFFKIEIYNHSFKCYVMNTVNCIKLWELYENL